MVIPFFCAYVRSRENKSFSVYPVEMLYLTLNALIRTNSVTSEISTFLEKKKTHYNVLNPFHAGF
jgi:beta-N-acetylglucosaminidase